MLICRVIRLDTRFEFVDLKVVSYIIFCHIRIEGIFHFVRGTFYAMYDITLLCKKKKNFFFFLLNHNA